MQEFDSFDQGLKPDDIRVMNKGSHLGRRFTHQNHFRAGAKSGTYLEVSTLQIFAWLDEDQHMRGRRRFCQITRPCLCKVDAFLASVVNL